MPVLGARARCVLALAVVLALTGAGSGRRVLARCRCCELAVRVVETGCWVPGAGAGCWVLGTGAGAGAGCGELARRCSVLVPASDSEG